jgi:hypothetical protein
LIHVSDWWATFATLAGLSAVDDCGGNPACIPLDGKDAWPVLTGAAPAASHRTELLLGVGGKPSPADAGESTGHGGGFAGALRSGPYKLIAPASQSDGWSAQYAGSTPFVASMPGAGTCTAKPCLFDLEKDPRETKDLSAEQPALMAKLFERYKTLARQMYAPNMPAASLVLAEDVLLESPEACDTDDCWEQKSHAAQLKRDAFLRDQAAAGNCTQLSQVISADWYLGKIDVFAFTASPETERDGIAMKIVTGCDGCKFTKGAGILENGAINLVASGEGQNLSHTGALSANADGSCRIHWGDNWRDFCQGKACKGGPGAPQTKWLC